jgi:uncharacterized membrane protein
VSAPYFDLVLTPSRPLLPQHARLIVGAVGLVVGLGCLRALALGAWPILPFAILDVVLLWWAFRQTYRSGAARESIRLDDDALVIDRGGRRVRLEPFWTRAELGDRRLCLAERGRRIVVGAFLPPDERREVHAVITAGLARWRDRRGA